MSEEPEVSYEQLVISLKEMTKQNKKQETLQKKLEERFKEKTKQNKELLKEKAVVEAFFQALYPTEISETFFDKQTKSLVADVERLLKQHSEIYEAKKPKLAEDDELMSFIQEENQSLKLKI